MGASVLGRYRAKNPVRGSGASPNSRVSVETSSVSGTAPSCTLMSPKSSSHCFLHWARELCFQLLLNASGHLEASTEEVLTLIDSVATRRQRRARFNELRLHTKKY